MKSIEATLFKISITVLVITLLWMLLANACQPTAEDQKQYDDEYGGEFAIHMHHE